MRNLSRIFTILAVIALIFSCSKENTPPVADFTIDPETGNDETIFLFDASISSDLEDDPESLLVIWDWEGDGIFDTQYAVRKNADHQYDDPGNYMVTLVVKDTRGLTDTMRKSLAVGSSNLPPEMPTNPKPAQNEEKVRVKLNLSWECHDPDGDYILYNIYFGSTNPPELVVTARPQPSYETGKLEYKTTYYWKVVARDSKGNMTEGPVWQFSTLNLTFDSFVDSRDGKQYSSLEVGSQWWMAENLNYEMDGSHCYDDNLANCNKYGRLYTWEAAMNACPVGWHLPSKGEFEQMVATLGGMETAGGQLKDDESGFWRSPNTGANNMSGFAALPAGRRYDHGLYTGMGYYAQFYSSTEYNANEAWNLTLGYDYELSFIYNYKKAYAISVRCVKD